MTQFFDGNGEEAVHAETTADQRAAIAAINHASAAAVFALSEGGEGVHAEGSGGSAGVAALSRGSAAGVFAKGLAGGVGCHAESMGGAPAVNAVAFGQGAGIFAKSHGGGPAAHFDGDVVVVGQFSGPGIDAFVETIKRAVGIDLEGHFEKVERSVGNLQSSLP